MIPFAEGVELRLYFGCCSGGRQSEGFVVVWYIGVVGESGGEGPEGEERCCKRR